MGARFEIGKQYRAQHIYYPECVYTITIVSRTDKTLSFSHNGCVPRRIKIHADENGEWIKPESETMAYRACMEVAK